MLSASGKVGKLLKKKYLTARIDLKPALTKEQLDARLLREFEGAKNKQFKNVVDGMFPSKLLPVMLEVGGVSPQKKVNEITREERAVFIDKVKAFPMTITGLRGFQEAIITKGGVQIKEIDPKTMESKKSAWSVFCGGSDGSGCTYRRIQSADRMVYGACGGLCSRTESVKENI